MATRTELPELTLGDSYQITYNGAMSNLRVRGIFIGLTQDGRVELDLTDWHARIEPGSITRIDRLGGSPRCITLTEVWSV